MEKIKQWAVFDFDDVLVNFAQSAQETLVKLGYPDIPVSAWKNYNIDETYGLKSHKEFVDIMINEGILSNSKVHDGVHDVLNSFKEQGLSIGILTARGWHPKAVQITNEFIEEHKLPIDKVVICAGHTNSKLSFASQYLENGEIKCYVDDSPQHIRDFKSCGFYAKLMRTSWTSDEKVVGLENDQVKNIREYHDLVMKDLNFRNHLNTKNKLKM